VERRRAALGTRNPAIWSDMNRRKTAAETGQSSPTAAKLGVLCEASGYLPLNNGPRQFVARLLAPQLAQPNLSPESEARRMGKVG
jgi:hypothetical protein